MPAYLCLLSYDSESREGIVKGSFVDVWVEVSDEQVGSHVELLLVVRGLKREKGVWLVQLSIPVKQQDGVGTGSLPC